MVILLKYHNINIRMNIQSSVQHDFLFEVYKKEGMNKFLFQLLNHRTPNGNYAFYRCDFLLEMYIKEDLSKFLFQLLSHRTPNGNYAFYLYNLYIEGPNKSRDFPNFIIQHLFNEVIQLFIDLKEQDRICADNVNNIVLNVEFNDSKDLNSTKLVAKLTQVYNKSKSVIISLYTGISLAEIQESLVDKELTVWYKNNKLISNAKKKMKPNIILPLNNEDVNSSSKASQGNDELTEEDLKITKCIKLEDGLTEEAIDCCFTSSWYDLYTYGIV